MKMRAVGVSVWMFLYSSSLVASLPAGGGDMTASKRGLTMEFNGVRVSYPQYLRLVRLQEKVAKLDSVINSLQRHR